MKDRTLLKQAYIATLCNHPDADFYKKQVFATDNLAQLAEQFKTSEEQITKADFFISDRLGRPFLDHPKAWDNFEKIVEIVEKNGERFEVSDFLQSFQTSGRLSKNFLDLVVEHNAFDKVFQAKLWMGRYKDMEELYYNIKPGPRGRNDGDEKLRQIKREIYAAEGKRTREDILQDIEIHWTDIPRIFEYSQGGIERLKWIANALRRSGEKLVKEDVLMPNSNGDTLFRSQHAWENFETIMTLLENGGQTFDVEDYLTKYGDRLSVLQRASQHGALKKVFDPQRWVGRVDQMMCLWEHLSDAPKSEFGRDVFFKYVSDAETRTYQDILHVHKDMSIDDFRMPIAVEGNVEILPLGLKTAWDQMEHIVEVLASKDQALTLKDLKRKAGFQNVSVFEFAVKNDYLDKVVDILLRSDDKLTVDDLMVKDSNHLTLLQIVAQKKQLDILFQPKLWAGRVQDMKSLWLMVDFDDKKQIDWQDIVNKTNILTLQKSGPGKGNVPRIRRRRQNKPK